MSYETRKKARREARAAIVQGEASQGAALAFILIGLVLWWLQGFPAMVVCAILALAVFGFRPRPAPDIDRRLDD